MVDGWEWDDTLFLGSAPYYERGRLPYAPGLADILAEALALDGRARLIDVGCGPGTLALSLGAPVRRGRRRRPGQRDDRGGGAAGGRGRSDRQDAMGAGPRGGTARGSRGRSLSRRSASPSTGWIAIWWRRPSGTCFEPGGVLVHVSDLKTEHASRRRSSASGGALCGCRGSDQEIPRTGPAGRPRRTAARNARWRGRRAQPGGILGPAPVCRAGRARRWNVRAVTSSPGCSRDPPPRRTCSARLRGDFEADLERLLAGGAPRAGSPSVNRAPRSSSGARPPRPLPYRRHDDDQE